jgi:hypothetical protein
MTNNSLKDWGLANILAKSHSTNIVSLHFKIKNGLLRGLDVQMHKNPAIGTMDVMHV